MQETDEDRIAKRAYAIWEEEGRPFGRDGEHWQRAYDEMRALSEAAPPLQVGASVLGATEAELEGALDTSLEGGSPPSATPIVVTRKKTRKTTVVSSD